MTDPDPSPAAPERPPSTSSGARPHPPPPEAEYPIDPEQQHLEQAQPTHGGESPPAPPFQPLFTLVTDSTTRATHHPRVHYIFADDPPEVLTDALAQYSHPLQPISSSSPSGSGSGPTASPQERAIVLDLVPKTSTTTTNPNPSSSDNTAAAAASTGPEYEVSWASSLSADWAVVSARLAPMAAETAPGTQNSESDDGAAPQQQRLMLRIDGVDISATTSSSATTTNTTSAGGDTAGPAAAAAAVTRARKSSTATAAAAVKKASQESMSGSAGGPGGATAATAQGGQQDYGAVLDEFDKRMGVLRKVVDAGVERQARMAAAEQQQQQEEEGDGLRPASAGVLGGNDQGEVGEEPAGGIEHGRGREQEEAVRQKGERPDSGADDIGAG